MTATNRMRLALVLAISVIWLPPYQGAGLTWRLSTSAAAVGLIGLAWLLVFGPRARRVRHRRRSAQDIARALRGEL